MKKHSYQQTPGSFSMIDNYFRAILPKLTTPLIQFYVARGITPNQLTVTALGIATLAALAVGFSWNLLAIVLWWLSRLLDGTDGILARETGQASPYGAFLDIVCDMAAYSIMIIGFAHQFPQLQWQWFLILVFYVLCITGALSLGSLEEKHQIQSKDNRGVRLAMGLAEAGETGIAYTLFLLFPSWINVTSSLWILVLLTTVLARFVLAKKLLSI